VKGDSLLADSNHGPTYAMYSSRYVFEPHKEVTYMHCRLHYARHHADFMFT
jgi:hypothetical protein